jgi:Xaa-Pro aminopeptidase
MVFTIEPGLYFGRGAAEDGAARYQGIGVRIEDDVLVTADGCEVLGVGLPTAAADVEALVALHA